MHFSIAESSAPAATYCPPRGFGAGFLRDHGVYHRARENALGSTFGRCSCAIKCLRGVTEQGSHICDSTLIRAEMNSERLHRPWTIPGTGNGNFAARGSHANIFGGKTQDPSLALSSQTPATLALKANHRCTSKSLDGWPEVEVCPKSSGLSGKIPLQPWQ